MNYFSKSYGSSKWQKLMIKIAIMKFGLMNLFKAVTELEGPVSLLDLDTNFNGENIPEK